MLQETYNSILEEIEIIEEEINIDFYNKELILDYKEDPSEVTTIKAISDIVVIFYKEQEIFYFINSKINPTYKKDIMNYFSSLQYEFQGEYTLVVENNVIVDILYKEKEKNHFEYLVMDFNCPNISSDIKDILEPESFEEFSDNENLIMYKEILEYLNDRMDNDYSIEQDSYKLILTKEEEIVGILDFKEYIFTIQENLNSKELGYLIEHFKNLEFGILGGLAFICEIKEI